MSSHDLTRVVALSLKAFELQSKRHFARAVEKFAAAIAAAQELSQVYCLVVAHLQLQHQAALVGYSATPGVAADAACAAKEQSCQVLLAAIATLERRQAAGTLLAGKCRSWPEEEWYGHHLQHHAGLHGVGQHTPRHLALLVEYVGYDAYLHAASAVCHVMTCELFWGSPEVVASFGQFAVRAVDLFEQPREIGNNCSLRSENSLNFFMQKLSEKFVPIIAKHGLHDDSLLPVVELLARWKRLERSGVLHGRGVLADAARNASVAMARNAASQARLAAATLRCCALSSCAARELQSGHYKQCGACKAVAYCCREHQLEDWPAHKAACKAARKAAAEEGGGAA